jgi:hypothetical protein
MLIIDDILFFPVKGIVWIFNEIYDAARQEITSEADSIAAQLSELYMMLETGRITEAEFDESERIILDRLDQIQGRV